MSKHIKDESTPYDDLPEVNGYNDIPEFRSEDEEAEFWGTHALGPGLLKTMRGGSVADALREIGFNGPLPEAPKKRRTAKK